MSNCLTHDHTAFKNSKTIMWCCRRVSSLNAVSQCLHSAVFGQCGAVVLHSAVKLKPACLRLKMSNDIGRGTHYTVVGYRHRAGYHSRVRLVQTADCQSRVCLGSGGGGLLLIQ